MSQRPTYSRAQLSQWLALINQSIPPISLEHLEADIAKNPLETLSRIQLWQLAVVPFGNLVLHYSPHHTVSLDTETLFTKIVTRGLGGYCMENNAFFATVLRSLGYDLYTTGARVSHAVDQRHNDPEGYAGWTHMLNIVTVDGQKHMVDVGFGSFGAVQPIRLTDGEMVPNVPPSEGRLVYKAIAPFTDSNQRMWIFEVRSSPEKSWTPQYCFSELEFLPQDFSVMNYYTSHSRISWFTQILVLMRLMLDTKQNPVGTTTLSSNELKIRVHGRSHLIMTCKTEEQRVQVLEDYFGAKLWPDEVDGIRGLPSEIKQTSEGL